MCKNDFVVAKKGVKKVQYVAYCSLCRLGEFFGSVTLSIICNVGVMPCNALVTLLPLNVTGANTKVAGGEGDI